MSAPLPRLERIWNWVLLRTAPQKASEILSDDERQSVVAFAQRLARFPYPFLLPAYHGEIYRAAGFDAAGLSKKLLA